MRVSTNSALGRLLIVLGAVFWLGDLAWLDSLDSDASNVLREALSAMALLLPAVMLLGVVALVVGAAMADREDAASTTTTTISKTTAPHPRSGQPDVRSVVPGDPIRDVVRIPLAGLTARSARGGIVEAGASMSGKLVVLEWENGPTSLRDGLLHEIIACVSVHAAEEVRTINQPETLVGFLIEVLRRERFGSLELGAVSAL